jgi:hypothetical protein
MWLDRLGKLKKSNDFVVVRTHNLLACSIVAHSTTPLHALTKPNNPKCEKGLEKKLMQGSSCF